MSNKQEVTFWATKEREPIVQSGSVALPDGGEIQFRSRNEYKAWRQGMKKQLKALRKVGK